MSMTNNIIVEEHSETIPPTPAVFVGPLDPHDEPAEEIPEPDSVIEPEIQGVIDRCPPFGRFLAHHKNKDEVTRRILDKAKGRRHYAILMTEFMKEALCIHDLWEDYDNCPDDTPGMVQFSLERTFDATPRRAILAQGAITVMIYSKRQMTMEELQYAIAVNQEIYTQEVDRLVPDHHLVTVCCGFIKFDKETRLVKLVHPSIREPAKPPMKVFTPYPQWRMAITSIHRLISLGMQDAPEHIETSADLLTAFTGYIGKRFWPTMYAYRTARLHLREAFAEKPEFVEFVHKFVRDVKSFPYAERDLGVVVEGESKEPTVLHRLAPIHVAVWLNLPELVQALVEEGADINLRTKRKEDEGWTPLMLAAHEGLYDTVKLLLQHPDVDREARDGQERTALVAASARGHASIVRLMLEGPD